MGGKTKQTTTSDSKSIQDTTQQNTNAGTPLYQSSIWGPTQDTLQKLQTIAPTTGDRIAAPGAAQQIAQHGAAPSVFMPQDTATSQAFATNKTFVPSHAQGTIDAGVAAAQGTQGAQQPLVAQSYGDVGNILQGPRNIYLQQAEDALAAQNNQNLGQQSTQLMQGFGSTGGVGSGNLAKALALNNQANATSYNNTIAGLENNANTNWMSFVQGMPSWLMGMTGAEQAPVQAMGQWTDQGQQNAQEHAATNDYNAAVGSQNDWLSKQLADTNATKSAQDAYDKWIANYQISQDQTGQANANTAFNQTVAQTGMDNQSLAQAAQFEYYNNLLNSMGLGGQLLLGSGDTTSTSHGTGQTNSTSTSVTQQTPSPAAIAGSVLGAGLQAFAPGGIFAATLGGLGKVAGSAMTQLPQMPNLASTIPQPQYIISDRRLKKDITSIGNGWYNFRYLWEPPGTQHVGVMADEVDPKYVAVGPGGYLMVNYQALMGG